MKILLKVKNNVDPTKFKKGDILVFDEESKDWLVVNRKELLGVYDKQIENLEKKQEQFFKDTTEKIRLMADLIENFLKANQN